MNDLPNATAQVLYEPGQEPEPIRQKIQRLKEKLDSAYPDKVVTRLHNDHKKWGETVTRLYRQLGYPDGKAFLAAYGYTTQDAKPGRPTGDHMAIIKELKRRCADGTGCCTVDELKAANPDLAPKIKSLSNQSGRLFGMTLAKYLRQEGILSGPAQKRKRMEQNRQEQAAVQRQQAPAAQPLDGPGPHGAPFPSQLVKPAGPWYTVSKI